MLLYFANLQILLSCEIKFCEILPCHTFYVATWIIHKTIFCEIIEIAIFAKFSWYTVLLEAKNSYIVALNEFSLPSVYMFEL